MFKNIRILILIFILLLVAAVQWKSHARLLEWDTPVWTVIYPIAADNSPGTRSYIRSLELEQFTVIETFFKDESGHYGLQTDQPVKVTLAEAIAEQPPVPPESNAPLSVILWSLQLRYWAWRNEDKRLAGDISLFVLYHDPALLPALPHSVGLAKGHMGVIHAFAREDMTQSNSVIITHELLHTFGATDKYNLATNLPSYPEGFAEPGLEPPYPQQMAEIMGGRIPLSPGEARIPEHLNQTVIGNLTAQEIGW